MRPTICFALLLSLAGGIGCADEKDDVQLIVVDRSMSRDLLYSCEVLLPKDTPLESAALVMYDRNRKKVGEALLGTGPTLGDGRVLRFELNHDLVKHSVVHVHLYPPRDDRHEQLRFVVGERSAWKKEGDKKVEVKIE